MAIESTVALTANTLVEVSFPKRDPRRLAWKDLKDGLTKWRTWLMLAYHDIKLRYRRSVLGPFWLTISMAITVYSMGYLYSHLFHSDLLTYFPFVVGGMLGWSLISITITDLIETFSNGVENTVKQIKLPYSLYIHRVVARNIIIFFHNMLVIIPILIFFPKTAKVDFNTLLLIPDLLLIYANAFFYGIVLAMLGSRYRDVSQMIKSLVQVVFFVTPIMWSPNLLPPNKIFIVNLNPFYSFVELVRAPLMGHTPTLLNYLMVMAVTGVGMTMAFKMFTRYRARIVYWL